MNELLQLDYYLFEQINQVYTFGWLDQLYPYFRNKYLWIPFYTFLFFFFLINKGKLGWYIVLGIVLSFGIGDLCSSRIIKPTVERLRPCNETKKEVKARSLVPCGSGYSFTSSHATNHFAISVFIILICGMKWFKLTSLLLLWSAIISYGQVYVGVHYPFDVLAGCLLGVTIGFVTYYLFKKMLPILMIKPNLA